MIIILTGSSGFLGTHVRHYLNENKYNIIPLNLRIDNLRNINVEVNSILHFAGKAHDLKFTSNPEEYYNINYQLTKRIYDDFLISKASKFIFISSVKAAADLVQGALVEDHSSNPQTHYGKSKLMAEEYIQSQTLPEGKSYYILRPCMIHGPGNKGNLNLLYQFVSKDIPYPLANFRNRRSFLSVENFCFVIKEILERNDISSGIYHMSDDETLSTNEVIELLGAAQGKRPKLWHISKRIISLCAKVGDKLKLPLNSERLQKLTESYVVSNEKIKQALGKDLPVSAREGILRTARSLDKGRKIKE